MPIIIDGHNLLWMLQKSGNQFDSLTDLKLCHIITRYLRLVSEKGHIVFDGTGPKDQRAFDNISNLEVSFSGLGREADEVIEKKITASTDPRRITLVSNDRRLRAAARAAKASAIKTEAFWNSIGMKTKFSDYGIPNPDLDEIGSRIDRHAGMIGEDGDIGKAEVIKILSTRI